MSMSQEPEWLKQAREKGLIREERKCGPIETSDDHKEKLRREFVRKAVADMNECEFQDVVVKHAQSRGWKVLGIRKAHVRTNSQEVKFVTPFFADGQGWPDLFMVRRDRALALELKVSTKAKPEQLDWQEKLHAAGIDCHVVRPKDWDMICDLLE